MIVEKRLIQEIFGTDGYGVPSGPALVYLYRRFGHTAVGSDPDKTVCDYSFPTAVPGLFVTFSVGGARCHIYADVTREVRMRYTEEERRPYREWWQRLESWALERGERLLGAPYEDWDLFLSQVTTWLNSKGIDEETVDDATWDSSLSDEYEAHCRAYNTRLRQEYEQVEPYPEDPPDGEFMTACKTAVADVLRDMLRPVPVRDVLINILGQTDTADNVAERCPYAGNAVPADAYADPHLFLDMMDDIRQLGQGDMVAGMTAVRSALTAVRDLVDYRDRVGAIRLQLEKVDDYINRIRAVCDVKEGE